MRRRRVRWIIGGGAGALVLATVLALTVGGYGSAMPRAAADGIAPVVFVSGAPVPYDRPQPWDQASATSRTANALTVFATGSTDSGGGPCGPPVLRFRVVETDAAIRVLVAGYQASAALATACAAIGYLPSPHTLPLQRAIGSREVIDASSGRRVALLDGARHPDLPKVPAGLAALPVRQWESGRVIRAWTPPTGTEPSAVTLTDQPPASVREVGPYGRVVQQTEVRGTPATVYDGVDGNPGTWFVQWTPNPRQTITLTVSATQTHRWSAAAALALARTVTGYATEGTGRLSAPSVSGTVAATYNSADGPLQNAQNLLKSSGVYVALDCAGQGRVTVTIRGRSSGFDCAAALSHHRFTSTGSPAEPFAVSVDAPAGVRWALSLARASLDGT